MCICPNRWAALLSFGAINSRQRLRVLAVSITKCSRVWAKDAAVITESPKAKRRAAKRRSRHHVGRHQIVFNQKANPHQDLNPDRNRARNLRVKAARIRPQVSDRNQSRVRDIMRGSIDGAMLSGESDFKKRNPESYPILPNGLRAHINGQAREGRLPMEDQIRVLFYERFPPRQ